MIKSFSQYQRMILSEGRNTHLTHIEDDMWLEGSAGVSNAIEFLRSVVGMLSGSSSSKIDITTKWDGAPAIFCGTHPENGRFFVGTKSVFNKNNPKINYTNKDIDRNHGGGLADKLKVALKYLPKLGIKGILQGDMMYSSGDLFDLKAEGETLTAFRPNTITYSFPKDSDEAKKVRSAKMGIVFHTRYTGKDMLSMRSVFDPQVNRLKKTKDVWFRDADFKDESGTATLTAGETEMAESLLDEIESTNKQLGVFIDEVKGFKKMIDMVMIYVNDVVKTGGVGGSTRGLNGWIMTKYNTDINKLKTPASKEKKLKELGEITNYLNKNKAEFDAMFELAELMIELKMILIRKLETIKGIGTWIQTDDGLKSTAPEGFVAVDRTSNKALKLVDRLEFSRSNFTVAKNWVK